MSSAESSFNITSVEESSSGYQISVNLDENSPLFEGHFPNDPIMPGVLNIEILEKVLSEKLNVKIGQINQIKFLKPVVPKSDVPIEYTLDISEKADDRKTASIKGTWEGDVFVKIPAVEHSSLLPLPRWRDISPCA